MKKALFTLFALMLTLGVSAGNNRVARKKIVRPVATASQYKIKKVNQRKADAKTVDLYFTEYGNVSFVYYDDTNDWYFGSNDDSGNYIIRLDYLTTKEGKYGTYTLSDLDPEYSYVSDFTGEEEVDHSFLEGTEFTISQEGYTLLLTGQLVCDNGVTYVLHGEIPLPEPQTYNIEGTNLNLAQYYDEDQDWYVVFSDDQFKVKLDLVSPTGAFAGTYTMDDVLGTTAFVTDMDSYEDDVFTDLNVTMSIPEEYDDPNVACEITGTAVGESGNTYNFHFKLDPPVKPNKVVDLDVNVDSAQWPSIYGGGYYELSEKENPDEKWVLQYWNLTGKYSENGLNLQESKRYNSVTGDEQTILHGSVSQTFDSEAMKVIANAELVMSDTIQYNINFETPIETKGEVSYSFTNLDLDNTYAAWGSREIIASNDQASIDVNINNSDVPGEYTDKDLYISLVVKDEEGNDNYISSLTVFNASTTIDANGNATFKARLLGEDMVIYNIDACFILPEITDTITVTMNDVEITDYTDNGDESAFYLSGSSEDGMTSVYMGIASTQIPGHYTIEDINEAVHGSGITFTDEDWNQTKATFYSGECDVTQDGRVVCLTGDFQAGSHFVHLTLNGKTAVPGAIDFDNEDEGIDINFTTDDLVAIETNDDGAYVDLQNEDRQDIMVFSVLLNEFDEDIVIPEGEYAVSQWGEKPCVQAGESWWDGTLAGTFYGTFDDEGYINTPLWFLAYGNATVTKNNGKLAFEITGQNSYYQPFHVSYNMTTDGISNHVADSAKVQKYMKGNNLIIRKAGKEYTAAGQQLK